MTLIQTWRVPICEGDEPGSPFQEFEFIHDEDRAIIGQAGKEKPTRPVARSSRLFKFWVTIEAIQDERGFYADLGYLGFIEHVSLAPLHACPRRSSSCWTCPAAAMMERDQAVLARAKEIARKAWRQLSASAPL